MSLAYRFGSFLLMFGIILLMLFVFSDAAGTPMYGFLLVGGFIFILAIIILRRSGGGGIAPAGQSERFRLFKRLIGRPASNQPPPKVGPPPKTNQSQKSRE